MQQLYCGLVIPHFALMVSVLRVVHVEPEPNSLDCIITSAYLQTAVVEKRLILISVNFVLHVEGVCVGQPS